MDRKMTLTNGSITGNSGATPGGGFVGFDAANLSASANMQILLQTNNDLILSIYKTIVDSTQEINRKIEALRDDVRDIKLNQQRNDRILQEEANMWRTHTEQLLSGQGTRHLQDVGRLQDMLMKMVIAHQPITYQQQIPQTLTTGVSVAKEDVVVSTTTTTPAITTTITTFTPAVTTTAAFTPSVTTTAAFTPAVTTTTAFTPSVTTMTTTLTTPAIAATKLFTPAVTATTTPFTPAVTTTPTITPSTGTATTTTATTFGVTGKSIPFGGSIFGGGANASTNTFASLAAKASQMSAKDFKFFSTPQTKTETRGDGGEESEKEEETAEDYTPDVHYEPVVPLPPEVEVVSGEEGEEVTFVARCKLYRYDRQTKENKERGLGDIKILLNPSTNKYRCVMRREKVFKICANFPIVHDLSLHKREQMPAVFTWACKDFSEDAVNGLDETFTARFKDANIAEDFRQKMTEAIDATD